MGGYLNIVLIISCLTFFFNKNVVCNSFVSAFMASISNSIMKLVVFCFPCLKDSILYSASAAFILSLKVILNFFLSQIRYSLVVILELNGVSEVQYKNVMMIDDGKYQ